MEFQVLKNRPALRSVRPDPGPLALVTQLTQNHQRIGRVSTTPETLCAGPHLGIFPRIRVNFVNYIQRSNPDRKNPTCQKLIEEDLSLSAFAALPEMRDVQSRFLGEVPPERLAFVGITERYDDSIDLFRRAFYPALPSTTERVNVNPERGGDRYELEPPVRSEVERLNADDLKPVSYTHLTLPTTWSRCRSRGSADH